MSEWILERQTDIKGKLKTNVFKPVFRSVYLFSRNEGEGLTMFKTVTKNLKGEEITAPNLKTTRSDALQNYYARIGFIVATEMGVILSIHETFGVQ